MPADSSKDSGERKRLGLYLALAQVGMEMVVPIGLGVWLDRVLETSPWLTLGGVVLGFVSGLAHMIYLANRLNREDPSGWGQKKP